MNAKNSFSISEERRRILLVEDDYVNQEMLKATLGLVSPGVFIPLFEKKRTDPGT